MNTQPIDLQFAISFLLEPIAYFLSCVFLIFHSVSDKRPVIKILAAYYFLATLLLIKAVYFLKDGSNLETYSLLYLITSFFLGIYFYNIFLTSWKKWVVIFLTAVEVCYYICTNVIYSPVEIFDSAGYVILSTGVMVMVFMFMHQILANVKEEKLSMNLDFWFVSSQMIYHFGSFVIFLTFAYLTKKIMPADLYSLENRLLLTRIWGIHNVLLFLSSLLTCGSILWITFHRKSPSS